MLYTTEYWDEQAINYQECAHCNGTGVDLDSLPNDPEPCEDCAGSGVRDLRG